MNSDEHNREAAYEQMMAETIKSRFEKNGTMAALQSEMHLKVLQLLRGQQDMLKPKLLTGDTTKLSKTPRDESLIKLINQLVMEFFNWFGYRHTLETFRMETGDDVAIRSELEERLFIIPDSKELPLLAQLVMRDWKSSLPKKAKCLVPQNPQPKENPEARQIKRDVKAQKLIQNNQKLIAGDPIRKVITIKQTRSPPPPQPLPMAKNADRKVSVNTSESDLLESDYSEESEDSDAYADIPDRHVFEDDLPPEGKYTSGHGEEGGPYDVKQSLAKRLFKQYQRGLTSEEESSKSQKPLTPKEKKCEKLESNVNEDLDSEHTSSGSGKQEQASKRKPEVGSKKGSTLGNEPETHIVDIHLDSDDSCE